jgi:putative transposase
MPGKNTRKIYVENGYYHVYNRGVEKRIIFQDDQDYHVFLSYLKLYLSPPPPITQKQSNVWKNNLFQEINLLAYCLMPNHFHLLIHQQSKQAINQFIQRIGTKYAMYFNKRYERKGTLFEGVYKAVLVEKDEQLLHLSRYIHLNPLAIASPSIGRDPNQKLIDAYSSYKNYLGFIKQGWIHPEEILSCFASAQKTDLKNILSYQSFVEDYKEESFNLLQPLTLDS